MSLGLDYVFLVLFKDIEIGYVCEILFSVYLLLDSRPTPIETYTVGIKRA